MTHRLNNGDTTDQIKTKKTGENLPNGSEEGCEGSPIRTLRRTRKTRRRRRLSSSDEDEADCSNQQQQQNDVEVTNTHTKEENQSQKTKSSIDFPSKCLAFISQLLYFPLLCKKIET